ncbi:MAG TPA: ABC transporter permease, partial [Candidatus Dormibacteraeota bacterium]|nr:ABC transporter permease [Candidatus Dormibacteraeota bacterium]
GRRRIFWTLYVPPMATLVLLVVIPLLLMAVFSFRPDLNGNLLGPFQPTLKNYSLIAGAGVYFQLLLTSMLMAAIIAAAGTLLAYPVAYFLAFRAGPRASTYLLLLLLPFWTSYLLRVMAWKLMLGEQGVINSVLLSMGAITEPLSALLYNKGAVVVTLIYVWIPFAALPILASLQRIDPALLDAGADLYARPSEQIRRIVVPMSLPGIVAAFFLVFIPTVGEYVTPLLVGGTSGTMFGNAIQDFFTKAANWPLGSALSMVMFITTIVFAGVALRVINVRRILPT